jgi:hypothetical protein
MARPKAGYSIDGEPVPGTTTICGQLEKPALMHWAFKQGRLAERGVIKSLYDKADEAKDAGTLAHELFEQHLLGQTPVPPEAPTEVETLGWRAYENARLWLEDTRLTVVPHEQPLVSRLWRYGGTPDATGTNARGEVVLLDWKSGGSSLYPEHLMQMAAYRELLAEAGVCVTGAHLVKFQRESGGHAHFWLDAHDLDLGWQAFNRLLELYPLMQRIKKRTK